MDNFAFNHKLISQQQQQVLQPDAQHQQSMNEYQAHIMPTPTTTSWNLSAMPWNIASNAVQPGTVMHFSAPITERKWQLHQKRKSDCSVSIPTKQFISEEKITAHFNGLHISSDYIQSNSTASTSFSVRDGEEEYENYQITAKELEQKLMNANRITLCDEIKKLTDEQRKVSFLPEALMNRITKPCTALVLWQPPPILEMLKHQAQPSTSNAHAHKLTRNNLTSKDQEDIETDADIDDFLDNNNTCSVDFNNLKPDSMDEDL